MLEYLVSAGFFFYLKKQNVWIEWKFLSHILIYIHVFGLPVELKNKSVFKKQQVLTTSVAELTPFNSYKPLDNNRYHQCQYISLEFNSSENISHWWVASP